MTAKNKSGKFTSYGGERKININSNFNKKKQIENNRQKLENLKSSGGLLEFQSQRPHITNDNMKNAIFIWEEQQKYKNKYGNNPNAVKPDNLYLGEIPEAQRNILKKNKAKYNASLKTNNIIKKLSKKKPHQGVVFGGKTRKNKRKTRRNTKKTRRNTKKKSCKSRKN